jgi:CBS domain-containing protein
MAEHDVGALPVVEAGELVGLVTERDYARKVILKGRFSKDTPVREIMTAPFETVTSKQNVRECMERMTDKRVRHLPVVENGQLAGIISIGDVVKGVIDDQRELIEELEAYITGRR